MPLEPPVNRSTAVSTTALAVNYELPTAGPFARDPARTPKAHEPRQEDRNGSLPQQVVTGDTPAIEVNNLDFWYPGIDGRPLLGRPPVVQGMSLALKPGERCLLIGPNGAGKTTLLKILGGKHMVPRESVLVLGRPPFHDTELTGSGDLSYLGGNWERDIAFAGYSIPLQGDFPASQMINSLPGVDPKRRQKLIDVLDIDPTWRMHRVSDGQRRRVQICMGLLKPYKVLLLDEITVDLDVLGRADLLNFLVEECQERGATIIYATHIFDGLEDWPTHLAYVAGGRLLEFAPAETFPEMRQGCLLSLVERWLRKEKAEKDARKAAERAAGGKKRRSLDRAEWNNGWVPGRLTSSLAGSSNTVMRM